VSDAQTQDQAGDGPLTLGVIAAWCDGRVDGDPETVVESVRPLDRADVRALGLVADPRYLDAVPGSGAGSLLVAASLAERVAQLDDRPRLVVEDPRAAMIPVLQRLDPTPSYEAGVHPTAIIERGVRIGENASVGPYAVLEAGAVVGARTRVGAHCVVGRGARIGEGGYLHPHVVLYAGAVVGDRAILHAGARIGADGFGYAFEGREVTKIPQVGRVVLGDDVEVGANACVDRGSIGDTEIGEGVKLDNMVQVGHNVRIGAHGLFAAQTGVAGSTTVGPGARVAGQVGFNGHIEIGPRVTVAPAARVFQSVPEADASLMGYPATDQREAARLWAAEKRLPELVKRVRALEKEIAALRLRIDPTSG
jgi:UDP-3-O-[3-hydroxymyristoyl] glucosamine N-acyltransferase